MIIGDCGTLRCSLVTINNNEQQISGYISLKLCYSLFAVFLIAPILVPDVFAATPEIQGTYIHSQEKCSHCHTDRSDLQIVLTASLGKCQECHENANPERAPSSHPQDIKQQNFTRLDEPRHKMIPNRDTNYGMQYPMYSSGTRLGDEPNKMVLIPAGEFIMGTDVRLSDEGPQHRVYLPDYYIDIYEVTNLQYKKFNDVTKGRSPTHWRNRTFPEGKADHPVVYVSWENANAYCQWAGKRLPTDQEWEKAARGTDGRMFPWGDEFDTARANTPLRWQEIGQFGDTTPVGSFEEGKSPYGVYDMSGNVWEWTSTWYKAYPGNKTKSESYGERYKTLKGGSWFDCSFYKCGISAPVFNRAFFAKKVKNDSFGFRCARDADKK